MLTINKNLDTHYLSPQKPVVRALRAMKSLQTGQILKLTTHDRNAVSYIEHLCRFTGLVLMQYMDWDGEYTFLIRKSSGFQA